MQRNGTVVPDRIKVKRGIQNYVQVGEVVQFKGEDKMIMWGDNGPCNYYSGSDSTIFHPYLYQDEDLTSFAPDMCFSLGAKYSKPSKVKGLFEF